MTEASTSAHRPLAEQIDQANALEIGRLLAALAHDSGAAVVCATHDRCVIEQARSRVRLASHAGQQSLREHGRARGRAP